MFDSLSADLMSELDAPIEDYEPMDCESCKKLNCDCDEQTMAAMEDYDSEEDYLRDQEQARETILNGDY